MSNTWLIGAGINLVGSIMINLGTNVMKLGHNKRAALEMREQSKVPIRVFREWQIGVVFFIVGNLANFISFGFAAQSLLAALGSVQFVSNVAFASFVLKEKVTLTILGATGCIVAGCVMLVLFGSHSSTEFTVEEMMDLYSNPGYIAYLVCLCTFVVLLYVIYKCGKKRMLRVGFSGLNHYWYQLLPVSYALFSGMIGTQSVLFGKTLSTLLRVSIGGNSQLGSWFTWVIILFFLLTSSFWITRLNKALKYFPAMMIVPTMQISWTFFSIASGMLYFQEYRDFAPYQGIMFTFAVLVVFFGVYLLTKMSAIDRQISRRLSASLTDEKEGRECQRQSVQTGLEIKAQSSTSWEDSNDTEDVRTPIVSTHASDRHQSFQDQTLPLQENTSISNSTKIIVEEDGSTEGRCLDCKQGGIMDDLSLDFCSSIKGTMGLGPESAPGVTLFGPPGVWSARSQSIVSGDLSIRTAEGPIAEGNRFPDEEVSSSFSN